MSVEAMSAVLNHSKAKGTEKLVLLGIANHQGDGGAWPTVATLARYANVTERAVQHALSKLVRSGELAIMRQQGGTSDLRRDKRPNRYESLVRCPQHCDGTTNHRLRDYPQTPDLQLVVPGTDGMKQASPGGQPGEAHVTPRDEAGFTQTVPTNPVDTSVKKVTTPRPRASAEVRAAALAAARAGIAEAKR